MYEAVLELAKFEARKAQEKLIASVGGVEPQLACGFAWVDIPDPKHSFVKWCKAQLKELGYKYDSSGNLITLDGKFANVSVKDYGAPHWKRGWQFWNPGDFDGQWVDAKEAGAYAFAKVLKDYDIPCISGSRYD